MPTGVNGTLELVTIALVQVDDALCGPFEDRPVTREPCVIGCGDVLQYLVFDYGPCSELCGGGFQRRDVQCINGTTREVRPLNECPLPVPGTYVWLPRTVPRFIEAPRMRLLPPHMLVL